MSDALRSEKVISARRDAQRWWMNEDWLAFSLGFLIILLVLVGIRPSLPVYAWSGLDQLFGKVLSAENVLKAVLIGVSFLLLSVVGIALSGKNVAHYMAGFLVVFALSLVSLVIAGNSVINYWGVEYVVFALLLGLLVRHTLGAPAWLLEAARSEYFIKTGLVILGAGIIFQELLQAGLLGILQALLVVAVVWYFCFWLAKRLRVDDELATMLASAVSICGVSAAIATCGAIQGDKKKLSYVTSLVLIIAIPMIVLQPWVIRSLNIPDLVGGAWLGGTLDTTGSVVAAGSLISETAMKAGTIVKFSQNVLLGVAAFLLSIWWAMRKNSESNERPSARLIWQRFPKFVIGFIAASLLFSFVINPALVKETKGFLTGLRTVWFALAFVSIGLETDFTELLKTDNGRPVIAFIGAQAFNVIWTLLLAFLIFGGVLFPIPSIR